MSGVTAYKAEELLGFAYKHVEAGDSSVSAQRLAEAIELIYREDGYFLAEVEIDTSAMDETVVLRVHEGRIDAVSIEGVNERMYQRVKGYLEVLVGSEPLKQSQFERAIALINDLGGVAVTTEIDYPENLQGARLRIIGQAGKIGPGSLTIDNPPRDFGSAVSVFGNQDFYSTLLPGDLLRLQASASYFGDEAGDGSTVFGFGAYRAPVGNRGAYFETFLGNVHARRGADGSFVRTDLKGWNVGTAFGIPIHRDLSSYAYSIFEYRRSEAESEGLGIQFDSRFDILSTTLLYGLNLDHGGEFEAGLHLAGGWRAGATPTTVDDGDDEFWHVRAGFGYSKPLDNISPNLAWRTEILGQYSNSRVPAVEELYLGDRYVLRGYQFDEAEGDMGIVGTTEISRTYYLEHEVFKSVTPFGFFDFGYVRNNEPSPIETLEESLFSVGVGLSIAMASNTSFRGWIGIPLTDGPTTNSGSPAVYLSVSKSW